MHGSVTAGHWGLQRTLKDIRCIAYWLHQRRDIDNFIKQCIPCNRSKRFPNARKSELQEWPACRVGQRVHIDLSGPYTIAKKGERYILSVVDFFTKYWAAVAIKDKSALTMAKTLVEHVYLKQSMVEIECSDLGTEFINDIRENIHSLLQIQGVRTVSFRPTGNSTVERIHRSLHNMMMRVVDSDQRNWAEKLPYLQFAYNCSVHSSTGYSPFFLHHGRRPNLPFEFMSEAPTVDSYTNYDDYTMQVQERLRNAFDEVRRNIKSNFDRNKRIYDSRVRELTFKPGQLVWFYKPRFKPRLSKKWQCLSNLCLVIRRVNNANYVIQFSPRGRTFITNIDRLRTYEGPTPEMWKSRISSLEQALNQSTPSL